MKEIQTNLNQICANCKYFSSDSPIICAVHPNDNLTEIDSCVDFSIKEKPTYQCKIFELNNGYRILVSEFFLKTTYHYWDLTIYSDQQSAETKLKGYLSDLILHEYPGSCLIVQELYQNWGIITKPNDNVLKWINPNTNIVYTQTEFDIPTYDPIEDIIQEIKNIIDEQLG